MITRYVIKTAGEYLDAGVKGEGPAIKDVLAANILDPFLVKQWALKLTVNAVLTVLRVDQVRREGGGGSRPQFLYFLVLRSSWQKGLVDQNPRKTSIGTMIKGSFRSLTALDRQHAHDSRL